MIQPIARFVLLLLVVTQTVWAQSPPVISGLENGSLTYREGDQARVFASSVRLNSDVPIVRAVVQITGYVDGEDQLEFPDTETIRGVVNEANGTFLLLSYPAGSSRAAADFEDALRRVTYYNTNDISPDTGPRTASLQVVDAQDQASNSATRSITVLAENDAPVVLLPNDDPLSYPAGTGVNIPVFELAEIVNGDNDLLTRAEVTINTGFQNSEDRLRLTEVPAGLAVTGNGGQTITISGPAPLATFERALRSIAFSNEPPPLLLPTEGIRRVTTTAFESTTESVSVSRFVVVGSPPDTPPSIRAVTKEVTAGNFLLFTSAEFAAQYNDPEDEPFAGIFIRSKPERGTLLLGEEEVTNNRILEAGPNGLRVAPSEFTALRYQAPDDYQGEVQFLWNAINGTIFAANSKPVRISVNPPELQLTLTAPGPVRVANDQSLQVPPLAFSATQQLPITVTLSVGNGTLSLPTDILPLLTFASGNGTNDGSLVFTGGTDAIAYALSGVRYTPSKDYRGTETLLAGASADDGSSAQTSVTITVVSNIPPMVSDLVVNTVENQPYIFRLADFTDQYEDPDDAPSFGPAQIYLTEAPQDGTFIYRGDSLQSADYFSEGFAIPVAEVVAGALVYAPDSGFSGSDQARWNASDGAGQAESDASLQIEVFPPSPLLCWTTLVQYVFGEIDTLRVNITAGSTKGSATSGVVRPTVVWKSLRTGIV